MYKIGPKARIEELQDDIDSLAGLPRNENPRQGGMGVRVGGGVHVPWADVWTERTSNIYYGPGNTAALEITPEVDARHGSRSRGRTIDVRTDVQATIPETYVRTKRPSRQSRRGR